MKTPVARAIRTKRHTLQVALCIGSLVVALSSHEAAAQDAVPFDVYGRPIADELGPICYRQDGDNWIAVHADGSMEPAPPVAANSLPSRSDTASQSGFHFDPYVTLPSGSVPIAVAIGDVTGDGRPDVVMTTGHYFDPGNDYKVLVYAQTADGNLAPPVRYSFSVNGDGHGVALADLDEDGVLDVVVGHDVGLTVFLANGQGGLRAGVLTIDADAYKVVATDVDRDGHMDVVSLGWSRGATIFYGDGRGSFRQTAHLDTYARGFNDLKTRDLTGDGVDDLAVMTGNYGDYLSIHRHDGVGGFVPGYDRYQMDSYLVAGVGLGDVSGDGLNDAVLSRPKNSPTWLWIMTQNPSDHRLTGPTTIQTFELPDAVEVADVDGDGREDVVVNHGSWVRLGVYLQTPGGGLSPEVLYPIPFVSFSSGSSMAIGDISSDGCADVVFGTYPLGLVVLHGSGCVPRCQPGLCDDNNPCTDDSCDPATGCGHANNTRPCDDSNACTTGDVCASGACHPGGPTSCDDGNCCTIDSCSPATGCTHVANTVAPVFTAQPSLGGAILWPPNHGYADFTLASTGAAASSTCGIASIQFVSCSSSQPENGTGTGDGNSMRDCVYEPGALHLRAERDGACSPIGRVYTTSLVAVDVCGNRTTSNPVDVGVWHDRGNPPAGVTVVSAHGSNQSDFRAGTNGAYGADCGAGGPFANGTVHDDSDADPEMEIAQQAAVNVDDLRLEKGASDLELTWGTPVQIGQVTRFHVWRLDAATLFWSQVAEVSKQTTSYQDPSLNDGSNWQYKVTAVIK
jgi:VCBS repeat protein/slime mold repeat-containing protein